MDEKSIYNIIVEGHIDNKREGWFDEMEMMLLDNGNTLLKGNYNDQAKLYSVLNKIRDLGLKLVLVEKSSDWKKGD